MVRKNLLALLLLACISLLTACHTGYEVVQVSGTRHEINATLDSTPHALAAEYLKLK